MFDPGVPILDDLFVPEVLPYRSLFLWTQAGLSFYLLDAFVNFLFSIFLWNPLHDIDKKYVVTLIAFGA